MEKYNGWSNWDTWECHNILFNSYEHIYLSTFHLTPGMVERYCRSSVMFENIDLDNVNFNEVSE